MANLVLTIEGRSLPFSIRHDSEGDRGVVRQIFERQDYRVEDLVQGKALRQYFDAHQHADRPALIVDAGANIGASAAYFSLMYPGSLLCCVEPAPGNFYLLERNTQDIGARLFPAAIGCEPGQLYLQDPGFSDWAYRVGDEGKEVVSVITPQSILEQVASSGCWPFIFKVDIEGGEDRLFAKHHEWMDLFALVVIELHDWMLPFSGSSRSFLRALVQYDFDFVHRGENIFCFNRRILSGFCG